MTNIELCSRCAKDAATINNMQTIIIPDLLQEIEDAKWILRQVININIDGSMNDSVKSFKKIIIENRRAIRIFYKRFPELKMVTFTKKG